jgi:hypothetical protein
VLFEKLKERMLQKTSARGRPVPKRGRAVPKRGRVIPVKEEPVVPGDEPPEDPPEEGVDYKENPELDAALEKEMSVRYPYRPTEEK